MIFAFRSSELLCAIASIMCLGSFCKTFFVSVAVITVILYLYSRNKDPIFSHELIAEITKEAIKEGKGSHVSDVIQKVHSELINRYGSHIMQSSEWIFMNCGGWMGSMYLLHASLHEYVLIFALGIDTSGNSGRYLLNITDTLISGTMKQWKEGGLTVEEFKTGDTVYHGPGEVAGVQWTGGTVMVEYGRGFIPSSLVFALADTFFSTTDFYIVFKVFKAYGIALFNELIFGNF